MAITKLEFPTSGTPTVPTDYNYQNEYIESNARGNNAVSMTNWDTSTTAPQIAAGSAIEINGATWEVTIDTAIVTSGASSGTVYVVFDDATPEFKLTNTAPAWSDTLNGWYTSGDRFTGHVMTWDGSISYTSKYTYLKGSQSAAISARAFIASGGELETLGGIGLIPETTDPWTYAYFPPGLIHVRTYDFNDASDTTKTITFEYFDGTTLMSIHIGYNDPASSNTHWIPMTFLSDGTNYRVRAYQSTAGGNAVSITYAVVI